MSEASGSGRRLVYDASPRRDVQLKENKIGTDEYIPRYLGSHLIITLILFSRLDGTENLTFPHIMYCTYIQPSWGKSINDSYLGIYSLSQNSLYPVGSTVESQQRIQ